MIKDIIEKEDKTKPLSDEAIAKMLRDRGINIARRTVAKYRQELKIPGTRERRVKK
jgi:RNA polymerase sigma-54 factor